MDDTTRQLITDLLSPIVAAVALGISGWIATKLPGPVRDALTSAVHARDMTALVGTMARRAQAEVADHKTPPPTAADLVEYTQRVRGALMAKMDLNPEGLETMARSAIAVAEKVTAPDAVVVPVVVDPTRP